VQLPYISGSYDVKVINNDQWATAACDSISTVTVTVDPSEFNSLKVHPPVAKAKAPESIAASFAIQIDLFKKIPAGGIIEGYVDTSQWGVVQNASYCGISGFIDYSSSLKA